MTRPLDRYTLEKAAEDAEILDICADAYLQARQNWKGGGPVPLAHTLRAVILALAAMLPKEPAVPEPAARDRAIATILMGAWSEYVALFGTQPHGTFKQLNSMLALQSAGSKIAALFAAAPSGKEDG